MNFGGALALPGGRNITAEALTLNGFGGASGQSGALVSLGGTNAYGAAIALGSAATISVDAGSVFNITSTSITGSAFPLTLGGAGTGTVSSNIATSGVIKAGPGTWTLTGASTFTGQTAVNAGILNLNGSLAATTSLAVNGGTLVLNLPSGSVNPAAGLGLGAGTFSVFGPAGGGTQTLGSVTLTPGTNGTHHR